MGMYDYWEPGQPLEGPERWYPVLGYDDMFFGIYEVSTLGRLRRIAGGPGTRVKNGVPAIVKTHPNSKGYWIANLWKDGERTTVKVHKVVAKTFLGDPPEDIAGDFEVHHKPDPKTGEPNKDDNRACNVEYLSAFDNMMERQDRYRRSGRIG